MEENLGAQIKQQRTAQGMTLNELSELSGFSISYLSQVERGIVQVSLEALDKISAALAVSSNKLLDFRAAAGPEDGIFYAYENAVFSQPEQGYFFEAPGPGRDDLAIDAKIITLLPGRGQKDYGFWPPAGTEGFSYVLDGIIKADTGEHIHYLNTGDCISYGRQKQICYSNETKRLAKLLFVCMGRKSESV